MPSKFLFRSTDEISGQYGFLEGMIMKMIQKLSLLLMALMLASCNEKVSPELLQSNVIGPPPTTPVAPKEFYFRVKNTSDVLLNYKLHKTGIGNANTSCEIKNTTGMSSDIFRGDPVTNDISCFFEAEELSLHAGGFKFAMEASQSTCDFVGYSAFGFYDKIPGDSTSTFTQVTCGNDTTNASHVASEAGLLGINIADTSGNVGCGSWISEDIAPGTRQRFAPKSDEELCRFNYSDDQCDIGTVTINEFIVTFTPGEAGDPPIYKSEVIPRQVVCGGAAVNCVKGPHKQHGSAFTSSTTISQTRLNEEYKKEYAYEGILGKLRTNMNYANYRRNLASFNLDYGSSFGLTPSYKSTWADTIFGKIFNHKLVDYYASNYMMDGSTRLVDNLRMEQEAIKNNKWKAKPLAADPFLGVERVNPYYTFYCFDTAMDIKARIRMVVRDWDRTFSSNSSEIELLSDLHKASSARMDAPGYYELPDDMDGYNGFNDKKDWDDFVEMERTSGMYDPTLTIWRPQSTVNFPDGWFNPANFPGSNL